MRNSCVKNRKDYTMDKEKVVKELEKITKFSLGSSDPVVRAMGGILVTLINTCQHEEHFSEFSMLVMSFVQSKINQMKSDKNFPNLN